MSQVVEVSLRLPVRAQVKSDLFPYGIADIRFLKNVSIAGGFLLLVANGAGPLSLDRRLSK